MDTDTEPLETATGRQCLDAIAKATNLPAYVEMTGGGVATIYVGERDEDDRFLLAIGPGTFNWSDDGGASVFYLGDLYVGPDDDGEYPAAVVTTLDQLTQAVGDLLRIGDLA